MIKKIKTEISTRYKKTRVSLRYLSVFKKKEITERPKIIFCCDGLFSHGGLLDRIKGIVSFYEVAKILGYDFYIYFNDPFDLAVFLEPNTVSWKIDSKKMKCNYLDTKVLYFMNNFNCNPIDEIKKSKSKNYLVYANVDYLATIYKQNSQKDNEQLWRNNFNELFRKSRLLENESVSLFSGKRLVFHLRFTSLMGDFKDTTRHVLNEDARMLLIHKIMKKIDENVLSHPDTIIYVLSDSAFFLDHIKRNTKYTILAGSPEHVDFSKGTTITNQSHLKTFSDFYFMVESDEVVMMRLDGMYSSSFSRYAAILGGKQFSIIQ
jgi:hypothetical protein